jgi:hypothetical protein
MEYFKFHIDEDGAKTVYAQYRDLSKGKSAPLLVRSFPLELISDMMYTMKSLIKK